MRMPNADEAVFVKVAKFRDAIDHLEQKIVDYHSCVKDTERKRCALETDFVALDLFPMVCRRASIEDMLRRERALERAAKLIAEFAS